VAVGVLGAACFLGEQKLLKLTGTHLVLQPQLWALLKGVVSGVFVSLLMPWLFCQLGLAPGKHQLTAVRAA
jgi:hypothetical protein